MKAAKMASENVRVLPDESPVLREAYEGIHAEEALVALTKARVAEAARAEVAHAEVARSARAEVAHAEVLRSARAARPFARRMLVPVAACLVALCMLVGCKAYFTEASVIAVEINPELELSVNRFDRVIGVAGTNDDGARLAGMLEVRGKRYDAALTEVVACAWVQELLAAGNELSVTVLCDDAARCERLYVGACACIDGQPGAMCQKRARAGWSGGKGGQGGALGEGGQGGFGQGGSGSGSGNGLRDGSGSGNGNDDGRGPRGK